MTPAPDSERLPGRYRALAINPLTIVVSVLAGLAFGVSFPTISRSFGAFGSIYVDLQRMVVLPFMVASIVFSLQQLLKDGGTAKIASRVFVVFLAFSVVSVALAVAGATVADFPGWISDDTRAALGDIVSADDDRTNTIVMLLSPDAPPKTQTLVDFLAGLVPSNIFAALANGELLRTLVFALLFGAAVSRVPSSVSASLTQTLDTVYRACVVMTRWIMLALPFALFAISASEAATHGFEPIKAMGSFVLWYSIATLVLVSASILVISLRSGRSFMTALSSMRETFGIAVATNNSTVCMPAMIDGLANQLNFRRARVELVIPIYVALLRTGVSTYFVFAAYFIAALYNRPVTGAEALFIAGASVMAGIASSGATGVATLTLLSTCTAPLGLPFEAAYVLFVTIDAAGAALRTLVTVIMGAAAASVVCERPPVQKSEAAKTTDAFDLQDRVATSSA